MPTSSGNAHEIGPAHNAVDGSMSGNARDGTCAIVNDAVNPWWAVDFVTSRMVVSVTIISRTDCCGE